MQIKKLVTAAIFVAAQALVACDSPAENATEQADAMAADVEEAVDAIAASEDAPTEPADAVAGDAADENSEPGQTSDDATPANDEPTGDNVSVGSARTQLVWCSDVRKRVSASLCQDYRDQIADLDEGVAAFDPPREMVKGKTREVRLAIGPEEERERIESLAGDQGQAVTAAIEIAAKMRARLTGRAFDIDPALPVDLEMGRSRRKVWSWDVTPKREGVHPLSAEITVLATDGTILNRYPSDLIRVNVRISESEAAKIARAERDRKRKDAEEKVNFLTKMAKLLLDFWWAVLALLVGLIGGFFYLRKRIRSGEATPPPGP